MTTQETIREIKAQFRLFMNGVASHSMREKGLDYKLNFGIELPRLKEISLRYEKNHSLAGELWKENIRECKILATLLQPVETFLPEIADIWVEDIRQPEMAELLCMNLFQHLPYASTKAFQWMADEREYFQVCGFLTLARLFMKGSHLNERAENEFLDQAIATLSDEKESHRPAQAALTALRMYVRLGKSQAQAALKATLTLGKDDNKYGLSIRQQLEDEIIE
ncbi:MAG: DNA alkylation repair protein [Bacteroidaceae bacterium]|nr:DNA alkylation repair protein [Bacteroidaceae bacterium]MBR3895877.1 DNA alkylation repair protein [Bacteroidaceae bacterium]